MSYTVIVPRSVEKYLDSLKDEDRDHLIDKLSSIEENPRCFGSKKLKAGVGLYRIRQNNYRIIYQISEEDKAVIITNIAHRKEVYKKR